MCSAIAYKGVKGERISRVRSLLEVMWSRYEDEYMR
jgi:hypothetical protein